MRVAAARAGGGRGWRENAALDATPS
eukprot:COSAG01_NODE_45279_length_410_cov_6.771704_1_plen_25_part_01